MQPSRRRPGAIAMRGALQPASGGGAHNQGHGSQQQVAHPVGQYAGAHHLADGARIHPRAAHTAGSARPPRPRRAQVQCEGIAGHANAQRGAAPQAGARSSGAPPGQTCHTGSGWPAPAHQPRRGCPGRARNACSTAGQSAVRAWRNSNRPSTKNAAAAPRVSQGHHGRCGRLRQPCRCSCR